ncbi:MAG: MCE family protein [Planctomycetaceae bacterium]|nr:MCE family protein [Planctomycetaceae bacterium]
MNEPLPLARVEAPPGRSLAWILPAITLLALALLAYEAWRAPAVEVRVRVAEGHGIAPGAPLRYRGVEVGRVASVGLAQDLGGVELAVQLDGDAVPLAREGSRFWVERPRIASGAVSGLETLFAGPHLVVVPGPPGGSARRQFEGLPSAPLDAAGGLEVVLETPSRGGVTVGAPVQYRQLPVGRVLSVGLTSDGGAVELRLWIEPEYAPLVRARTRFWEASGLSLRAGLLDGIQLDLESLESLLLGGVAFATPPEGGAAARTGQRFALAAGADPKWLEWRPSVAVGAGALLPGGAPVRPSRAALSFESGLLWSSKRTRSGWVLAIDGQLLGPADLLRAPEGARDSGGELEFEGRAVPVPKAADAAALEGLATLALEGTPGASWPADASWPKDRRRAPDAPEDVLLWADGATEPIAVSASRWTALRRDDGSLRAWRTEDGMGLDRAEWHGALVLARTDGALLGILRAGEKELALWPLPPEFLTN